MKKNAHIPFTKIAQTPSIVKDFLNGELSGFGETIFSVENVKKKIKNKKASFSKGDRELLCSELTKQMSSKEITKKQRENLEYLAQDNTFTITTGHQLNLFSGPVFFIYKILQTLHTTQKLNEDLPEYRFVPVFWMATEDHDFEEIKSFHTEQKTYTIHAKQGAAVGRIVPEDFSFLEKFRNDFKDFPYGEKLVDWITECYQPNYTFAQSTRLLVQKLFSERGLLVLDGDSAPLKNQMKKIFERELQEHLLKKSTEAQVNHIIQKYGKAQVNPREINLFYLTETRNRIVKHQQFEIVDKPDSFSEKKILEKLKIAPENFSPNALMRPVYQEKILPNIAYIGGNAEIAYWIQLKDFFEALELPFPILIPRQSILWLTPKQARKMEKWHFPQQAVVENLSTLLRERILRNPSLEESLENGKKSLSNSFRQLKEKAELTDVSFLNLVAAEEQRQLKSFNRMRKRLYRAERRKQEEYVNQIESWYKSVHPHGTWQERVYNFSVFYAVLGEYWLQTCYELLKPEEAGLILAEISF